MLKCTSNKYEYRAIAWSSPSFHTQMNIKWLPNVHITLNKYENQAATRCSLPFPKHVNTQWVPSTDTHFRCKWRSGGIWYTLSFEAHVNINWSLNNHFHLGWKLELVEMQVCIEWLPDTYPCLKHRWTSGRHLMLTLDWGKGEYWAATQYPHLADATSSIEQLPNIHLLLRCGSRDNGHSILWFVWDVSQYLSHDI
jgi:hypothetical protein